MNILIYMSNVMIGGVRTVTEILTRSFEERGHTVLWLIHKKVYNDSRDFPSDFKVFYLPDNEVLLTDENVRFYHSIVNENNIEVIINQNGMYEGVSLIDTIKTKVSNIPIISVLHNNPAIYYDHILDEALFLKSATTIEYLKRIARIILLPRTKYRMWRQLKLHYKALEEGGSTISVLSPRYISKVHQFNENLNDVVAIANPNTYREVVEVPKEKIVLFVGRLDNRSKRIPLLLRVWKSISAFVPDWKLVIVGEGPSEDMLKSFAKDMQNVEFVGYANPTEYYQISSILCMTSIFEGFPMVLTEAMQHGCVPMAFDSFPAVYDIITSGKDGEIVEWNNLKAYKKKLYRLIKDDAYRNMLSKNSRTNVKRYDTDNIIDQWEKLINDLKAKNK